MRTYICIPLFCLLISMGQAIAQSEPKINGLTHSEMQQIQADGANFECTTIDDLLGRSRCDRFLQLRKTCPSYRWVAGKNVSDQIKATYETHGYEIAYRSCEKSFHADCVNDAYNEGILDCHVIVQTLDRNTKPNKYELDHKQENELARAEKLKFDACRTENPLRDKKVEFNERIGGDLLRAKLTISTQTQALKDDEAASKISGVSNVELRQGAGLLIVQARKTLDELMATYESLGGSASNPDEITSFPDPCAALIPKHQETHLSCGVGFSCGN